MAYKFGSARYGWYAGKDKDGNFKWTSKRDCAMPVKDIKERDEIHAMLFEKGIMHDVEYEYIPWVDDVR